MENTFQANPGEKILASDSRLSEDERDWASEAGGFVRWCPDCGVYDSPNSPCFCGVWVVQMGDKFWGNEGSQPGWVDGIFDATHFYPGSNDKLDALVEVLRGVYGGVVHTRRWGSKKLFVTCQVCGEKHEWYSAPEGKNIPCGFGEMRWACDSNKCREILAAMRFFA